MTDERQTKMHDEHSPLQPGVPESITSSDPRELATLRAIMRALRTPVTGCPWDLEQNFATIAPYTVEEAYEVADAIERGNKADLCDELGDLLLQVIYHTQLAEEEGSFTFADVVEAITTKMIRRHPHVFGDDAAKSATLAKDFWETNKAKEKLGKLATTSVLSDVPLALPALIRAVKLQAKAARVGFDWPTVDYVYDKITEEIAELRQASLAEWAAEYGDLLFALVNVARHSDVNPEQALEKTNQKFIRRFNFIERELEKIGKTPEDSTLEEMDSLWDKAKLLERSNFPPAAS